MYYFSFHGCFYSVSAKIFYQVEMLSNFKVSENKHNLKQNETSADFYFYFFWKQMPNFKNRVFTVKTCIKIPFSLWNYLFSLVTGYLATLCTINEPEGKKVN